MKPREDKHTKQKLFLSVRDNNLLLCFNSLLLFWISQFSILNWIS